MFCLADTLVKLQKNIVNVVLLGHSPFWHLHMQAYLWRYNLQSSYVRKVDIVLVIFVLTEKSNFLKIWDLYAVVLIDKTSKYDS